MIKSIFRYAATVALFILILKLIWLIGMKGFASWVLGFWIITLVMAGDSLIRFLLQEKRKKRFGK
jgi:type IV secretory pathway TrbD component